MPSTGVKLAKRLALLPIKEPRYRRCLKASVLREIKRGEYEVDPLEWRVLADRYQPREVVDADFMP